jgi:hypothetical protein
MGAVGDPEREAASDVLRSAYVRGYLSPQELSERLGGALSARSLRELGASVRDLPGGARLVLSAGLGPILTAGSTPLRRRAGRFLCRLALAFLAATSALVALGLGVWTLADGLSAEVALGFLLVWFALSTPSLLLWRGARRLLR